MAVVGGVALVWRWQIDLIVLAPDFVSIALLIEQLQRS